jgi:hypothetical protein
MLAVLIWVLVSACGRVGYDGIGSAVDAGIDGTVPDGSIPDGGSPDGGPLDGTVEDSTTPPPDASSDSTSHVPLTGDYYLSYSSVDWPGLGSITAAAGEVAGGLVMNELEPDRWEATIRAAPLEDGVPERKPDALRAIMEREPGDRWILTPMGDGPEASFLRTVSGEEWTFTMDASDPRNDGLEEVYASVSTLVASPLPPSRMVGNWRVTSVTVGGMTTPTGTCIAKGGEWGIGEQTMSIAADHVTYFSEYVEIYGDAICTDFISSSLYELSGFTLEHPDLTADVYLWDEDAGRGLYLELVFDLDAGGGGYTLTDCLPLGCEDELVESVTVMPASGV